MMISMARAVFRRPRVAAFSSAPKKSGREIFEEKEREKINKEPETDEKDETSY